jgi:hypothetical protein
MLIGNEGMYCVIAQVQYSNCRLQLHVSATQNKHHQGVYKEYKTEMIFVVLVKKGVECVQATFVLRQDVWCLNVAVKQ